MYNNSQKIRVLKYLLVIRLTILGKRIHLLDLREIASLEKPHLMFLFFRYICLQNQVNILLKIQRHLYEKLKVQFLTSQQIYILQFWPKKSSPWYLFLVTRKTLRKSIILNLGIKLLNFPIHLLYFLLWYLSRITRLAVWTLKVKFNTSELENTS